MRKTSLLLIAACSLVLMSSAPGHAQQQRACQHGRALNGECIDPNFSQSMTRSVIVSTQPKFSYTAPPYLPSADRDYSLPRDHHEISNLFTYPPVDRVSQHRP